LGKSKEKAIDKTVPIWYNRCEYAGCWMLDAVYWIPVLINTIGLGLGHRYDYSTPDSG
jgi:hypothetical protein